MLLTVSPRYPRLALNAMQSRAGNKQGLGPRVRDRLSRVPSRTRHTVSCSVGGRGRGAIGPPSSPTFNPRHFAFFCFFVFFFVHDIIVNISSKNNVSKKIINDVGCHTWRCKPHFKTTLLQHTKKSENKSEEQFLHCSRGGVGFVEEVP